MFHSVCILFSNSLYTYLNMLTLIRRWPGGRTVGRCPAYHMGPVTYTVSKCDKNCIYVPFLKERNFKKYFTDPELHDTSRGLMQKQLNKLFTNQNLKKCRILKHFLTLYHTLAESKIFVIPLT